MQNSNPNKEYHNSQPFHRWQTPAMSCISNRLHAGVAQVAAFVIVLAAAIINFLLIGAVSGE